MEDFTETIVFI